jgi:hypothetical protein
LDLRKQRRAPWFQWASTLGTTKSPALYIAQAGYVIDKQALDSIKAFGAFEVVAVKQHNVA